MEHKEIAMKRNPIELIQPPLRGLAPMAAVVCLSFAGAVSAQEAAPAETDETKPAAPVEAVKPAGPDAQAYVAALTGERKQIYDGLAKAYTCLQGEEFTQCLEILGTTEKLIEAYNGGKANMERAAMLEKLQQCRITARQSYAESIYAKSREAYLNVLSNKDLIAAAKICDQLKKDLAGANYMFYLGTFSGDPEALAKAEQDSKSDFGKQVKALIASCDKISDYTKFMNETSVVHNKETVKNNDPDLLNSIDPGYEQNKTDIQVYYREAEQLYRERRYTQARDKAEKILILDPYNERASQLLTRVYRKLYAIADMRQYNEMLNDEAIAEWTWAENLPQEKDSSQEENPRAYQESNSPLFEKARSLVIPSIIFDNARVLDAIAILQQKSKDCDPDRNGVQIMGKGIFSQSGDTPATVTFELQSVPLLEAIRYLCLHTNMKYRIDEKGQVIVIGPKSEIERNDTKAEITIPVRHATVERMTGVHRETGLEGDGDSEEGFSVEGGMEGMSVEDTFSSGVGAAMSKKSQKVDYSQKLKDYFTDLGFSFPEDTYIVYSQKLNRITVRNTPDVLRKLEMLVREIDIETPLVLIEAKIMEIAMHDLEELGFDWTLTHDDSSNPNWSFAIQSPLRNSMSSQHVLIDNMNILPNFGSGDHRWNLYLTINAVDRTDRTEVLSTPKLMAKNGEPAEIRMVQQMYFPEEWEEPEISTSCGDSISVEPSVPTFGDPKDVGVIFNATPNVSSNNYTIALNLAPKVVALVSWSDYSYDLVFGDKSTPAHMTLKMPELSNRQVDTNVKVYDGQTVVIGGMLTDRQSRQNDRWPILGEIPLLGRLFTQNGQAIEKDNLLISVTARLISGDGTPIRQNTANGLPDFRR